MVEIKIKNEVLKMLMARKNISQSALAEYCNINKSYVSKIISEGMTPSAKVRKKILEILDVTFDELFVIGPESVEKILWEKSPKEVKFGLITWRSVPFSVAWEKGWEELSQKYGFTLYKAKTDGTTNGFLNAADDLLFHNIDILIEPGNISAITSGQNAEKAIKAGAVMITLDVLPLTDETKWGVIMGASIADTKNLGIVAGRYFKEHFPGREPVALILEGPDYAEIEAREIGFIAGIKRLYSDMTFISMETSSKIHKQTKKEGYFTGKEAIIKHPHINIVYSPHENYLLGALNAFEKAGRGKVDTELFCCFNTSALVVEKLKDPNSALKISLALYPVNEAERAFLMGMRIVNNIVDWENAHPKEIWKSTIFTPDKLGKLDNYLKKQKFL